MYYQKPLVRGQVAFWGIGDRISGIGYRGSDIGYRGSDIGYRGSDIGYRVSDIGYWLFYNGAGVVLGVVAEGDFGDVYALTYR